MSRRRWIRLPADRSDTVGAAFAGAVVAAGAGLVTFYLTRLFLAREPVDAERGEPGPGPAHDAVGPGRDRERSRIGQGT